MKIAVFFFFCVLALVFAHIEICMCRLRWLLIGSESNRIKERKLLSSKKKKKKIEFGKEYWISFCEVETNTIKTIEHWLYQIERQSILDFHLILLLPIIISMFGYGCHHELYIVNENIRNHSGTRNLNWLPIRTRLQSTGAKLQHLSWLDLIGLPIQIFGRKPMNFYSRPENSNEVASKFRFSCLNCNYFLSAMECFIVPHSKYQQHTHFPLSFENYSLIIYLRIYLTKSHVRIYSCLKS